ncbi:MAG: TatD family hydrolase, partial [Treponema sp.]|nr:TatD family hydrolase [Treponema sp.]
MLTDAHCHPYDLVKIYPDMEEQRRHLGVLCAASASDINEFTYHEELACKAYADNAAGVLPCFAMHPQLPAISTASRSHDDGSTRYNCTSGFALLEELARTGRLAAVGETGFDLYNEQYRETEAIQEEIFSYHIDIALLF